MWDTKSLRSRHKSKKKLSIQRQLTLYDNLGHPALLLSLDEIDDIHCICVTRDDFGLLAVNLSLLLEKDEEEPFPWAVNIIDLSTFVEAWEYFGWGPEKFTEYLEARIKIHRKLLTPFELEIGGYFIKHGGIHWLVEAEGDILYIDPNYSDVFDQIYHARNGGKKVEYSPTKPYFGDMREQLAQAMKTETENKPIVSSGNINQGRNERCACGSGKKYKYCCGK